MLTTCALEVAARRGRGGGALLCFLLLLAAAAGPLGAAAAGDQSPSFTAAQAAAGKTAYELHCASCHGRSLGGVHITPGLVGKRFDQTWRGKSLDSLFFHLRRMPPPAQEAAGGEALTLAGRIDILAYLLAANGVPASETALPSDTAALREISIPGIEGETLDPLTPVPLSRRQKIKLDQLAEVDAATLHSPPPEDWLQWGRTSDGQNFSPLEIIDKSNVSSLTPAWRTPLAPGLSMAMPLVHDGVLFLQTFPDSVLALDAETGDILWRYRHATQSGPDRRMGLALFGDRLFVPTADLHVLALEAKTGKLLWDHGIDLEVELNNTLGGHTLRSAPLIAGDVVIQGVTASIASRGGFLVALDLETGRERWRFDTIARPGAPGGETWNGVPLDQRSGGSVWHQGTYDPELGLVYYGVAPTYDTGPLLHPSGQDGVSREALFTNCTIALDPKTGKLVWHYQHLENDQWDLDWSFERQVVELAVNGAQRKVVLNVGKMAILEALDAATGEYLFSIDAGIQNVITAIDPETGAKSIDPQQWPDPQRQITVCPSAWGARSWPPASYSARTGLVYVPLTEGCMGMGPEGFQLLTSGVGLTGAHHPRALADDQLGVLQAYDLAERKLAWRHDQPTPLSTSTLATAGGVVFAGDVDPSLKAFDDASGELLWRAALDDLPSSTLVTYRVRDRQFLVVVVGLSNNHVRDITGAYDSYRASAGLEPASRPNGGAAIWAFALER